MAAVRCGLSQPASVLCADIVIYMTDKGPVSLEPGEALHRSQRAATSARQTPPRGRRRSRLTPT